MPMKSSTCSSLRAVTRIVLSMRESCGSSQSASASAGMSVPPVQRMSIEAMAQSSTTVARLHIGKRVHLPWLHCAPGARPPQTTAQRWPALTAGASRRPGSPRARNADRNARAMRSSSATTDPTPQRAPCRAPRTPPVITRISWSQRTRSPERAPASPRAPTWTHPRSSDGERPRRGQGAALRARDRGGDHRGAGRPGRRRRRVAKDADLAVVGSRGLNPLQRLLMGSVSSKVVHRAECDVLVLR